MSHVEVLGNKSTMHIRVTLYCYTEGTWLYCDYYIWCAFCTVVVLTCFVICGCMCGFCNVWVCVRMGFVIYRCVYVWVL